MAWEYRDGNRYYYRKRREGKRVVSEYVGGGLAGELSEIYDNEAKWKAERNREELQQTKANAAKIDEQVKEASRYTEAMTRAVFLLAGYHAPRRQWRKIRQCQKINK